MATEAAYAEIGKLMSRVGERTVDAGAVVADGSVAAGRPATPASVVEPFEPRPHAIALATQAMPTSVRERLIGAPLRALCKMRVRAPHNPHRWDAASRTSAWFDSSGLSRTRRSGRGAGRACPLTRAR